MKKRSDSIDYAKGIGILLVLLGHMRLLVCEETIRPMINVIYSFHMPLFFFVSGLTLDRKYLSRQPDSSDVKKLASRLMIPYFSWSAVYIVLKCVIQQEDLLRLIKRNAAAVLTLRGIAPLWFLSALFIAELMVMLLVYRLGMKKLYLLGLTGVLTLSLGNAVQVFRGAFGYYRRLPIITFYRIFPCIFFVTLGCVMSELLTSGKGRHVREKVLLMLGSAAVFTGVQLFANGASNLYKMSFDSPAAFVIAGTAGSIMTVTLCTLLPEDIIPLRYLGRSSMLMMVLHYPPFPTILLSESLAESLGLTGYACAGFVFVMTVTVTSALCIIGSVTGRTVKAHAGEMMKKVFPVAVHDQPSGSR